MTDMINPSHYHGDRKFEPIAVIEDWGLNYRLGCALKYISRNGRKPGEDPCEGLRKAIWYLEREIAALDGQKPYKVEYEDVLDYYGQSLDLNEAWPDPFEGQAAQEVPFTWDCQDEYDFSLNLGGSLEATPADWADFWDPESSLGDDVLWDPSVGPVELSEDEIKGILAKKALDQFEDVEIVATVEKRGFILGIKKDGSSCILKDGRCA